MLMGIEIGNLLLIPEREGMGVYDLEEVLGTIFTVREDQHVYRLSGLGSFMGKWALFWNNRTTQRNGSGQIYSGIWMNSDVYAFPRDNGTTSLGLQSSDPIWFNIV